MRATTKPPPSSTRSRPRALHWSYVRAEDAPESTSCSRQEETTVGRSPDCDVFLDDVTVSRRHALVVRRDGRFFIEDRGSLNGTFLNRRRIESGPLEDGDEVQIGKYRLTFLSQ